MGKRGPKPKPKALKDLQGTYRPDREAPNAPEPEPGVPELPEGWVEAAPWGAHAAREYYHMAPALKGLGLLAKVDRAALLLYCDAWGRWTYYREMVGQGSDTQETPNGYRANSPETNLMNKAAAELKQCLAMFGLSPADRTRVSSMAGEAETRNPFEELRSG